MKTSTLKIIIFLYAISISCCRVEYFPDNPINFKGTCLIAHKGGGQFDDGNTLEGCKYGLKMMDGIECDLQRSSDNTLWLNHSSMIHSCGSHNENCFASLSDKTIIEIDSCLGASLNYTQLEDVFKYMSLNYPNKVISLDVKAWNPCDISGINITKEMNEMGQKIIDLTIKYNLQNKVMVESETGDFLYYIKTHTSYVETYLSTNGDFELGMSRALNAGFSGISFKYKYSEEINKQDIAQMHQKGLKIQLWTVNDTNYIKEAISLNPDFLQTDSLNYITKLK